MLQQIRHSGLDDDARVIGSAKPLEFAKEPPSMVNDRVHEIRFALALDQRNARRRDELIVARLESLVADAHRLREHPREFLSRVDYHLHLASI